MNRRRLLTPNLPIKFNRTSTKIILGVFFALIPFLPWVAFTVGNGQVTAINPNERVQSITATVSGFIQNWNIKEGDRVREGDVIAQIVDNDPDLLERLRRERDAAQASLDSANLALQTAKKNLDRQKTLYEQGLSARKDYEKAQIDYSKLAMEKAKAQATLAKAETQLSRQISQKVVAPRDGTIIRILPGERGQLIKAGSPIVIFSPDVDTPAVEVWIDGNDAAQVVTGQKANVQFEGWPSIQIPGWPSLAINAFPGRVYLVDQASSYKGKFRVLIVPDGPWPSQKILRLGIHSRAYIQMADTFVAKEAWRQLNSFPAFEEPIHDELNKVLNKEVKDPDGSEPEKKEEK